MQKGPEGSSHVHCDLLFLWQQSEPTSSTQWDCWSLCGLMHTRLQLTHPWVTKASSCQTHSCEPQALEAGGTRGRFVVRLPASEPRLSRFLAVYQGKLLRLSLSFLIWKMRIVVVPTSQSYCIKWENTCKALRRMVTIEKQVLNMC